jgi:predicted transposase YbfD/YdcC
MDVNAPRGVLRFFRNMADPRDNSGKRHSLLNLIVIAISAIICGADGWEDIAFFGRCKRKWFESFLDMPHGIPSHDTFGRVFARLSPDAFEACFRQWMAALSANSAGRLVAVDGKTLRGSFDTAAKTAAVHMISAWCQTNQTVLGQIVCDDKTNEITNMPKLLELLDLDGAVVTADAMHCQKKTAEAIIQRGGNYLLQVKDNQHQLHEDLRLLFQECMRTDCHGVPYAYAEDVDKGHGRIEIRRCWTSWNLNWMADRSQWKDIHSVVRVQSTREINGKTATEDHYYISSLPGRDAARMLELTRGHWSIENQLHWRLDVVFQEDQRRIRQGHAAENYSRLSRIALNLLKADTQWKKASVKARRKIAGWEHDYLLHLLTLEP